AITHQSVLPSGPIPKGLRPPAQGCEPARYPGKSCEPCLNPNGVAPTLSAHGRNPVGVGSSRRDGPRVARSSQPWALLQNPFGIHASLTQNVGNDKALKRRAIFISPFGTGRSGISERLYSYQLRIFHGCTFASVSFSARADCCSAICSLGHSLISTCFSTPLRLTIEGTLRQIPRRS